MGRNRERHQLPLAGARGPLVAAALLVAAGLSLAALRISSGPAPAVPGGIDVGDAVERSLGATGDEGATSVALELLGGAEVARRESDASLVEEGERVLGDYRARGDCVVARAGYLDLAGRTWGCVVQGAGWVELCVVREVDEGGSEVVSWRMDADDVER